MKKRLPGLLLLAVLLVSITAASFSANDAVRLDLEQGVAYATHVQNAYEERSELFLHLQCHKSSEVGVDANLNVIAFDHNEIHLTTQDGSILITLWDELSYICPYLYRALRSIYKSREAIFENCEMAFRTRGCDPGVAFCVQGPVVIVSHVRAGSSGVNCWYDYFHSEIRCTICNRLMWDSFSRSAGPMHIRIRTLSSSRIHHSPTPHPTTCQMVEYHNVHCGWNCGHAFSMEVIRTNFWCTDPNWQCCR